MCVRAHVHGARCISRAMHARVHTPFLLRFFVSLCLSALHKRFSLSLIFPPPLSFPPRRERESRIYTNIHESRRDSCARIPRLDMFVPLSRCLSFSFVLALPPNACFLRSLAYSLVHSRARRSSATRPSERCCHLFVPLFLSEYLVSELHS